MTMNPRKQMNVVVLLAASVISLSMTDKRTVASDQERDWCPHDRLGRFSDWSEPINLGAVVNSKFNDQHPAISKDGLSLYFSSDRPGGTGGQDIWVSQRPAPDEPWRAPQNLGANINSAANDLAPNLTPDGQFLYFHSERPTGCGPAGTDDLYVSRRDTHDDFAWRPATNLGCTINSPFADAGPTFFHDHKRDTTVLYFTSARPGGQGGFDIYVSTPVDEGAWGPGVLVPELSSQFRDTRTSIGRDGLEMLLSSDRPGSGSEDIWVSTRTNTERPWSQPMNLGAVVNSPFFDGAPALSWDGTTLYFFSDRPGGFGNRDLYVTTRARLHRECDHDGDDDGYHDGRDRRDRE